jgi:hypothetical protein
VPAAENEDVVIDSSHCEPNATRILRPCASANQHKQEDAESVSSDT